MTHLDRRRFLQLLSASSAGVLLGSEPAEAAPRGPRTIRPLNPAAPARLQTGLRRRILVIGGGLAGLSAALELAERGYEVVLREAAPELGGKLATRRLASGAGSFNVEHGLHMWFHNYHNFRDLRRRLGIDRYFRPYREIHFTFRNYHDEVLTSSPPIYPLNMIGLLERSKNFNLLSATRQLGLLGPVLFYDHTRNFANLDQTTFLDWMRSANLSQTFRDVLLLPAAGVTLNDVQRISAAEMVMYMHYYFTGHPLAMNREVTTVDHGTAVIEPWAAQLRTLGVRIETGSPVLGLELERGEVVGEVNRTERYDGAVLACDVPGVRAILSASRARDAQTATRLVDLRTQVDQLGIAPPYQVLRLWFDRRPHARRPTILESPQHPPITLLAQFHQLEEESRVWADAVGGAVIEFHLYAVSPADAAVTDPDAVWRRIAPVALELLPELNGARVLGATLGSYENFTSFEVGQATIRPRSTTPAQLGIENLGLAGDWVGTDYPSALMERAVSTGREAANALLARDGVRQVPLTVTSSHGPGLF